MGIAFGKRTNSIQENYVNPQSILEPSTRKNQIYESNTPSSSQINYQTSSKKELLFSPSTSYKYGYQGSKLFKSAINKIQVELLDTISILKSQSQQDEKPSDENLKKIFETLKTIGQETIIFQDYMGEIIKELRKGSYCRSGDFMKYFNISTLVLEGKNNKFKVTVEMEDLNKLIEYDETPYFEILSIVLKIIEKYVKQEKKYKINIESVIASKLLKGYYLLT